MSGLSKNEIAHVYKKGKRIYTQNFVIYFLSSLEFKYSPVVSKKISKKAVIRNKIKRRIRHLCKLFFNEGLFIVVAKQNISNIDFEQLKDEFKTIANQIY